MAKSSAERALLVHEVYVRGQQPFAWLLIVGGISFFFSNFLEVEEPYNKLLSGLCVVLVAGGIGWLAHIKSALRIAAALQAGIARE